MAKSCFSPIAVKTSSLIGADRDADLRSLAAFRMVMAVIVLIDLVGTMAIELLAPLLLLSPFFKGPVRTLGVMLIMSLHLGILVTMNIGYFPLLSAFSVVCFLPPWFWDTLVSPSRDILPFQARTGRIGHHISSLVLALRRQTGVLWDRSGLIIRGDLSQPGRHDGNSNLRIGSADDARLLADTLEHNTGGKLYRRTSLGSNLLAGFFLMYVFVLNVTTVTDYTMPLPSYSLPIFVALGLDQRWAMYSSRPTQFAY